MRKRTTFDNTRRCRNMLLFSSNGCVQLAAWTVIMLVVVISSAAVAAQVNHEEWSPSQVSLVAQAQDSTSNARGSSSSQTKQVTIQNMPREEVEEPPLLVPQERGQQRKGRSLELPLDEFNRANQPEGGFFRNEESASDAADNFTSGGGVSPDTSSSSYLATTQLAPSDGTNSLAKRKLLAKPSMVNLALVSGRVSLSCDISPASADDSVALILWYKDDSLAPIYTIDARKASSLDRAKISIDEAYTNRASFNMKSRPAHLQLNPVRQDDEGDYRCRVDFKRGRTVNTIISLRVIIPPEDIRIVSPQTSRGMQVGGANSAKLEGLIGPFNEGSELTLICMVTGGKPRPQITWHRDDNVIDKTYQHLDKDGTSNELKIASLNKNHRLSEFICKASNNNLTSPLQSSITLDLNLKPQEVSLKQVGQEPLVVGQTATFECVSHGSRPEATVYWLFQDIRHDTPMNVYQQQTSSRITLTLQQSFNQQPLTCVAENQRIPQSSALRQTIKLDVHYPPQLSIKLEHQPQLSQQPQTNNLSPATAANGGATPGEPPLVQDQSQTSSTISYLQEGNDIYLTCQMDANPRPMKPILWRFNGKPMPQQQSSNMIVMNNQSLVLRKVSRHQSGQYSCDATNQHGSNSSKPMELIIRHAPVCSTDDILIFEANLGNVINIDCNVIANPSKSVHYSWFFGSSITDASSLLENNNNNLSALISRDAALDEQIDESSSRLKYKIKDENSFGLLKCKAKNAIGLQQKACLFHIAKAQLPVLRHGCSLMNASSTNLQLKCEPNEHLKSEDFELVVKSNQQQQQHPPRMGSWINLDAMRQQQQQQHHFDNDVGQSNRRQPSEIPTMRLVWPPNWLMAELYKSSHTSSHDSGSESSYNLSAYIVVGSSNQLPHIKSIVEENHLFSSNPKSVYYVIAKQIETSSSTNRSLSIDQNQQQNSMMMNENVPISRQISSGGRSIIEDPSIQIANSFAFTIPSLEPQSKYKLLIYGQNLANKTRDWLIVRGETKPEEPGYESRSQIQPMVPIRDIIEGKTLPSGFANQTLASQKSIVMRSDTDQTSSNDEPTLTDDQTSTPDRLTARNNLSLMDKVQQLVTYKDYAVTYAKQKPLLAVPIAVSVILILILSLIWTVSFLVHCLSFGQGRLFQRKTSIQRSNGSPSTPSNEQSGARRSSTDKIDLRQQQLNQYANTTPDNSSDSNSHQESSSRLKRDILANGNTIHPMMNDIAANCSIYTVGDPKNNDERLFDGWTDRANQQQKVQFMGSLDRRQVHHQHNSIEPIYLTDAGGELFQLQQSGHYHIGSIDRRTGLVMETATQPFSQPALILANPGEGALEQSGICLQQGQILNSPRCSQSEHYNGSGSLSSTQYSGSTLNQSVQVNTMVVPAPRNMKHQKVAFDLSNQQKRNHSVNMNEPPIADCRRSHIVSPTSLDCGDIGSHQYNHHQRGLTKSKQGSLKGSDSGGSNSANTADSGHESPPTGETIVHSNSSDIKLNPERHLFIVPGQTGTMSDDHNNDSIDYYRIADAYQQGTNPMMMLMELSPGSQESSATMIQSIDSLGDTQTQMLNNNRLPDNLHQVATSFTSDGHIYESRGNRPANQGSIKGSSQHQHGSPAKLWL